MVVVMAMLSACSFMQIRPTPKPATQNKPPACASLGWAGLDLLGGLASALAAKLSTATFEGGDPSADDDSKSSTYFLVGTSIVYGASMIYGVVATSTCHSRAEEMSKATPR